MAGNGFFALAQYDDDGNGAIDEMDPIFAELRLWQDLDHDGISQPAELRTLTELGVAGISLAYAEAREADQHGNSFRYKATVYGTPGSPVGMTAWDVWLVGVRPEPVVDEAPRDLEAKGNPKELKRALEQLTVTKTIGLHSAIRFTGTTEGSALREGRKAEMTSDTGVTIIGDRSSRAGHEVESPTGVICDAHPR